MSIASRIIEIENHISNAYDKIEDLGENLTGVNKNIDNIASKLDNIYSNLPKVTGTGTEVTLENTKAGKMVIQPKGNTSQYSTTGKNLVNIPSTYNITGLQVFNFTMPLSAGTYTISLKNIELGGNTRSLLVVKHGDTDLTDVRFNNNNKSFTFTANDTITSLYFYSQETWVSSQGVTTTYYEFMMELNSTPTSYEPYTGGIASPNPSYPQPIKNVTGDNNVVIRGKNLFDINNEKLVDINSTGTQRYGIVVEAKNKNVSISGTFNGNIAYKLLTNNVYGNYVDVSSNTTIQVAEKIVIYVGANNVKLSQQIENLQIEISDTPTPYEPYITPIEKELKLSGKNKWNNNQLKNLADYFIKTETGFKFIKTNSGRITPAYNLDLEANTQYIISCILTTNISSGKLLCIWKDENNNELYNPTISDGDTLFTPTVNIKSLSFYIQHTEENGKYVEVENFMIRPASIIDGTYEPYYNYTLMQDDYITEDCVIHHKRKQIVVNLVNNNIITLSNGNKGIVLNLDDKTTQMNNSTKCTKSTYTYPDITFKDGTYYQNPLNFVFCGNSEDTIETFKTKYNNSILEYELAEETTETIPNTIPLYNQIKALYRTIIPGGTIIVETESDEENAQLIVNSSALKSFENS